MTNLYNLSPRPKIVFIHGLNNHDKCMDEMMKHFKDAGYETDLIILPGHGKDRDEARDLKTALRYFDQSMKKFKDTPYSVIAFSHGALYLQLWLERNQEHKPLKQILLAPAIYIRRQALAEKLVKFLPPFFMIKSLSPKPFRRYQLMKIWEYKTLIDGLLTFQKFKNPLKIPTQIYIDLEDELVDARKLKEKFSDTVEIIERKTLKGLGSHHIIFHPNYFEKTAWDDLMAKSERFLK